MSVAGCGPGEPAKPDLPGSVSPGWTLRKMEASAPPEHVPKGGTPPMCWRADYTSEGEATVWACGYRVSGSAFDAWQRMNSAANEVKFQKGQYLVIVQWNNVSQTSITALVSALQRSLPGEMG